MIRGKVTLVLFWYPSMRSSGAKLVGDYLKLAKVPDLLQDQKDFQIISIIADSSSLTQFRRDNPGIETYTVIDMNSHSNAAKLARVGMPTAMLVDRQGNIARIESLGNYMDEQAMIDKIREVSMR